MLYRQLRKEGVAFPMRDPNMRMLMENLCHDSPMFDFVEESAGREVKIKGGDNTNTGTGNGNNAESNPRAKSEQLKVD